MSFNKIINSFEKNLLLLLSKLRVANEEIISIFPTYCPKFVLSKGVTQGTIDLVFKNVKYLEKVIVYDRRQPEFFEDTKTYVTKRATRSRTLKAQKLLIKNEKLFNDIEKKLYSILNNTIPADKFAK